MDFQTPIDVCDYMANFLPNNAGIILEPTKGEGNLVNSLSLKGEVIAPDDFFDMKKRKFDWIVMNPPFTPMAIGYKILDECLEMTDNLIALMPWLTLINGEKRTSKLFFYGLVSVTHLPRTVFRGSRVQTCILEMKRGFNGDTKLFNYVRKRILNGKKNG